MKIAVGLSGGVDSAVAALLLKRQGHEVAGITMKLWREGRYCGGGGDACFGPGEKDDIEAAAAFAEKAGIPFHVFDCSEEYEKTVLEYFREEHAAGRTPNPCVVCNRFMKFGLLPRMAAERIEFDKFATGHYVRTAAMPGGRVAIARAADAAKDQSYFLWRLSQEQISGSVFPLGGLTKRETRAIAAEAGLPMAEKPDSQDFYSGDCNEILGAKDEEGEIVSTGGKVLGRHRGCWHYTIGQRQGLGIGGGTPFYVVAIDKKNNRLVVGTRDEAVSERFRISGINWMGAEETAGEIEGFVKIRSSGAPAGKAVLEAAGSADGARTIRVPGGIFGVAPGQSAVLYSADGAILCGGAIML